MFRCIGRSKESLGRNGALVVDRDAFKARLVQPTFDLAVPRGESGLQLDGQFTAQRRGVAMVESAIIAQAVRHADGRNERADPLQIEHRLEDAQAFLSGLEIGRVANLDLQIALAEEDVEQVPGEME